MALPNGYEIRQMSHEDFFPLVNQLAPLVFEDSLMVKSYQSFESAESSEKIKHLRLRAKEVFSLRLGLFFENEFVGWSYGNQETVENAYYMRNSAVLPAHRRKGLYTALMNEVVRLVSEAGFQKIVSRHNNTNNDVIIAKLNAGFFITQLEVSDVFGVLVHLCKYPLEIRRKVLDFRSGQCKPDSEVRALLDL